MKKLFIKLFRDIKGSFGSFIAVIAVSAIGVALLTGFSAAYASMRDTTADYYKSSNLAEMSVYYLGIDDAGVSKIKNINGVADAYGRIALKASAADGKSDFLIHSISSDEKIDVPRMNAGNYPQGGECMIDKSYAQANSLAAGDTISAVVNGQTHDLRISGIFNTAEYVYLVEDPAKDPMPEHKTYGLLYVDKSMIGSLISANQAAGQASSQSAGINPSGSPVGAKPSSGAAVYNEVLITLNKNADADTVKKAIEGSTDSYGFGHITMQKDQLSFSQLQSDIDSVRAVSDSFPYIFFLVAAAIIFISMSRAVQSERGQIGIMKALGIKAQTIAMHYLSYSIICGLAGSILGNILGMFGLSGIILGIYAQLYTFPSITVSGFWLYILLSTGVVLLFGVIASIISTRKVLAEAAAQCMRPAPPRKVHKTWLEKHEKLWGGISYKNKLILRNILLNKQRAFLSSIGIIGCVGVLMCGLGLSEATNNLYTDQFTQMQKFDDMVLLSRPLPFSAPEPFENENIRQADKMSIIQATMVLNKDESTILYLLPAGNETIRLFSSSGKQLDLPSDGIVVPYKLAQQYRIKAGDTISVRLESVLYKNTVIRAKVAAIDVLYLSQDLYASYDYLNKLGIEAYVNGYYVNVKDKGMLKDTNSYISGVPNIKSVVSNATLQKSIASMLSIMNTLVFLMIFMSAALALAVIFNISSINIFERRRDIATLKVLGYHRKEINSLVYVENFIITALGCIPGIVFGAAVYKYLLIAAVSQDMYFPYKISFRMVGLSVGLAFVFTMLTNFMLRGKTRRIDMVESLKGVE